MPAEKYTNPFKRISNELLTIVLCIRLFRTKGYLYLCKHSVPVDLFLDQWYISQKHTKMQTIAVLFFCLTENMRYTLGLCRICSTILMDEYKSSPCITPRWGGVRYYICTVI